MEMKNENYFKSVYLTIGVSAFLYILYRAIYVGITYDEAWTINGFVPLKVIEIINYTRCDANNHILNTLLIKFLYLFFNHSLFVARIPNVFAFFMYSWYGYKITYKYLKSVSAICCFLLLLLNPFLLDFFSIARGYGLSLAFLLASVYYLFKFAHSHIISNVIGSVTFAAVSVLCNFAMLNYWIVLIIVINVLSFLSVDRNIYKKTLLSILSNALVLIIIIYEPIRKLKKNGNLYYGGNSNFYEDTLVSLTKYTFYSTDSNSLIYFSLNIFLLGLISSVLVSYFFNPAKRSPKNVILSVTLLCISSLIAQHYLLGTLYLIDRTALFFYPLLIFCFCFSINDFSVKYSSVIGILFAGAFSVNFINKANSFKTAIWYFDAHTTEILRDMNEIGKKQNRKVKIDFSWPFQSSFGYYCNNNSYPYVEVIKNNDDREELNTEADFYIYLSKSLEKVGYDAKNQKIMTASKEINQQFIGESVIVYKLLR